MNRVLGKVCLVTGAGAGLGRADAIHLAEEGATVVVTDIDVEAGKQTALLAGNNTVFVEQNVADEAQWQTVINETIDRFGKLNVLVNNAGVLIPGDVETATTEDWHRMQRINLDSIFFGMKYGIAAMKDNGEPGSIINLSSITALQGYSDFFGYGATKGAIRTMTKHAAVHCQNMNYNIRVNSVHPGVIDTPMVQNLIADIPPEDAPPPPAVGLGESADVANAIVYLASDESKFINGIELPVDNGAIIRP